MGPRQGPIAATLVAAMLLAGATSAHANTSNTVDTSNTVGTLSAIAIAPDGYPVIAYDDSTNGNLKVFDCDDAACSTGTATTVESTDDVGNWPAIVIGVDGFPIIAHHDATNGDLRVFDCSNATCSSGSGQMVDGADDVGAQPAMVLGTDGNPIIAYRDSTNDALKVADCSLPNCSLRTLNTPDAADNTGLGASMVLGADDDPIIAYWAANGDVRVYDCDDPACSAGGAEDIDTGITFFLTRTSMVLGTDDNPIVAYTDVVTSDSFVFACGNTTCSSGTTTPVPDATTSTIVLGVDGNPIVLFATGTADSLETFKCSNTTCSSGTTTTVAGTANSGFFPSMVLGTDSSPVFSYFEDVGDDLAVYDCSTPNCGPRQIDRLSGSTRIETAIAASQNAFGPGGGNAVVLARADLYPDALVGGPLASVVSGPLLLTPSNALPPAVVAEIGRVLPPGATIHVLGGTAAISTEVTDALVTAGYVIVRYAGTDRFDTAVRVANAIGALGGVTSVVLLGSGRNFPDALSASAAAAWNFYPVLLTDDDQPAPATTGWIGANTPGDIVCVGGPACSAYPASTVNLVGSDRYETAALVADHFFTPVLPVGVASGERFPDALVAAADTLNRGGPLVLTRANQLPAPTGQYVDMNSPMQITIYGGTAAVGAAVESALTSPIPLD